MVYLQEGVCACGCTSLGHRSGCARSRETAPHVSQRGQRATVVLGKAVGAQGLAIGLLLPAVRPPAKTRGEELVCFLNVLSCVEEKLKDCMWDSVEELCHDIVHSNPLAIHIVRGVVIGLAF